MILKIANTLSDLQPLSSISSVGDVSLFGASLQNLFTNFITFVRDDDIPSSNNLDAELPSTTKPEALSPIETLTISPTRLKTISSMRDTLGQLEADFTEFHMTTTGDLEQLKDKTVKQDHLIKLQKQSSDDLLNDFSSQITSLQKIVSQQSNIIKKLQDENQILHKKHVQIDKANQALQESQNNLMTEIHFLKEQMTALWQNSKEPDPPSPSSQPESSCSENTTDSEQKNTDCEASRLPITAQKLTVNIPTENRFSLLQNCDTSDSLSNTQQEIDPETNTENMTPPTPQDIAPPPIQASVNNKAVFLCDSNGKFIDKRKLFQPTQDFTFFRCPKIEHARAILQVENDGCLPVSGQSIASEMVFLLKYRKMPKFRGAYLFRRGLCTEGIWPLKLIGLALFLEQNLPFFFVLLCI